MQIMGLAARFHATINAAGDDAGHLSFWKSDVDRQRRSFTAAASGRGKELRWDMSPHDVVVVGGNHPDWAGFLALLIRPDGYVAWSLRRDTPAPAALPLAALLGDPCG
jgi:hypothetical protein